MPENLRTDIQQNFDEAEVERNPTRDDVPFSELFSRSFGIDSSIVAAENIMTQQGFTPDQEFIRNFDENKFDELLKGRNIPREYYGSFEAAVNEEHFQFIADEIERELGESELIAAHGVKGFSARLAANLADPVAATIGLATGGLGAGLVKGGRVGRFFKLGFLGGTESAAIETLLASGSPVKDENEVMFAAASGFLLAGGVASLLPGGSYSSKVEDVFTAVELAQLERAGVPLSQTGRAFKERVLGKDEVYPQPEPKDFDALDQIDQIDPEDAGVGAQTASPVEVGEESKFSNLTPERIDELSSDNPGAAFSALRFDVIGRLLSSRIPASRGLAARLAEDGATHADANSVNRATASEQADLEYRTNAAEFYKVFEGNFKDWRKRNQSNFISRYRLEDRKAFNEAVSRYIRGIDVDVDPAVKAVGDRTRSILGRQLSKLKEAGVRGFDGVENNPNYVPRVLNRDAFYKFVNEDFSEAQLIELLSGSLRRSLGDTLEDAKVNQIARGYARTLARVDASIHDIGFLHGVDIEGSSDLVRYLLLQGGASETDVDDIVEDIISNVKAKNERKGVIANARPRLDLDETYAARLQRQDGTYEKVEISSLWENDIEVLLDRYNRTTSGWIGLASRAGIDSPSSIDNHIRLVREQGRQGGVKDEAIQADVDRIEGIINHTIGRSLEHNPNGNIAQWGRLLRTYNYARQGGQFGFAQLAELGNTLGLAGMQATIRAVPELSRVFSRAQSGELEKPLLRELENLIGMGTDWLRNPIATRPDDFGFQGAVRDVDVGLVRLGRLTSAASGMAPVNAALQRFSAAAAANQMVRMAGKKALSETDKLRLRTLGIDESMANRIFKQIQDNSQMVSGVTGKRVKSLGIDNWTDLEATEMFRFAMHRYSRRIIQENDIGSSALMMHSTLGKIVFQFRNFALTAITKQTMRGVVGLSRGDMGQALAMMWTMSIAGLAYTARQYANYSGDQDKLKENLSTQRIAAAAFANSGYASMIPGLADGVLRYTSTGAVFSHNRTSQLASGVTSFASNPTGDLFDRVTYNIPKTIFDAVAENKNTTPSQVRGALRILPLQNMLGVTQGLDLISRELAEDTE